MRDKTFQGEGIQGDRFGGIGALKVKLVKQLGQENHLLDLRETSTNARARS